MTTKYFVLALIVVACSSKSETTTRRMPEMRMTAASLRNPPVDKNQIGSSGLSGVRTKVLYGDPSKPGLYSILLYVPANTTIPAAGR